jgi:hypothetical protein
VGFSLRFLTSCLLEDISTITARILANFSEGLINEAVMK